MWNLKTILTDLRLEICLFFFYEMMIVVWFFERMRGNTGNGRWRSFFQLYAHIAGIVELRKGMRLAVCEGCRNLSNDFD